MRRGVEASEFFVMVLTKSVLFRPFCVVELVWAIKHHGAALASRILFVAEEDSRFAAWDELTDAPWVVKDDLNESTEELEAQAREADVDLATNVLARSVQGRVAASVFKKKVHQLRRRLDLRNLKRGLQRIDVDFGEAMADVQRAIQCCAVLPYRRREYEEAALMARLLERCELVSPETVNAGRDKQDQSMLEKARLVRQRSQLVQASVVVKETTPLLVLAKRGSEAAEEVKAALKLEGVESVASARAGVLLLMLEDGMFAAQSALTACLEEWCCGDKQRPLMVVQNGWSFNSAEQEALPLALQMALFNTEIMPLRSLTAEPGKPKGYDNAHERPAMAAEIKRRLLAAYKLQK